MRSQAIPEKKSNDSLISTILQKLQDQHHIHSKDIDKIKKVIANYEALAQETKLSTNCINRFNALMDLILKNKMNLSQFTKINTIQYIDYSIELFLEKKISLEQLIEIDDEIAYKLFLAKDFIQDDHITADFAISLPKENLTRLNRSTLELYKNKIISLEEIFQLTENQIGSLSSLSAFILQNRLTLETAKTFTKEHARKIANVFPLLESKQLNNIDAVGMSDRVTLSLKMLTPLILAKKLTMPEALILINNPMPGHRNDHMVLHFLTPTILSGKHSIEKALAMRTYYDVIHSLTPLIPEFLSIERLTRLLEKRTLFSAREINLEAVFYKELAKRKTLILLVANKKITLHQLPSEFSKNPQSLKNIEALSELVSHGILSLETAAASNKETTDILINLQDYLILQAITVDDVLLEKAQPSLIKQSNYLRHVFENCIIHPMQIKALEDQAELPSVLAKMIDDYTEETRPTYKK